MNVEDRYCLLNGEIVSEAAAVLSPFDRGFIYGDAVYEVLPAFKGEPFGLDEHLRRLEMSLGAAFMPLPVPSVTSSLDRLMSANAAWMRSAAVSRVGIWISRGVQPLDWRIDPEVPPTVFMFCWPVDDRALVRRQRDGVRLVVASRRRVPADVLDPRLKMTSRLPMALAEIEVAPLGDMPLLLDTEGRITETSSANVFLVQDGHLVTPHHTQVLGGVTRDFVMRFAREAGYQVEERDLRDYDCVTASEAFVTSSTSLVIPVGAIVPHRTSFVVPGPVTQDLMKRMRDATGWDAPTV